jgi:hypothetical protein
MLLSRQPADGITFSQREKRMEVERRTGRYFCPIKLGKGQRVY